MLGNKRQEQRASEGATALQAGGDLSVTFNQGLSYQDVRDIARDVARELFRDLTEVARELAQQRAEEVTTSFLDRLMRENPAGLNSAREPDFQFALAVVQKEHARYGDKELSDLLIQLLADRSKRSRRSLLQLVLTEALGTAPKLTDSELAALSIVFFFKYLKVPLTVDYAAFGAALDRFIQPFVELQVTSPASYQHLQYAGCIAMDPGGPYAEELLIANSPGLFFDGLAPWQITSHKITIGLDPPIFVPCLRRPSLLQINAIDEASLIKLMDDTAVPPEDQPKLISLFRTGRMPSAQAREVCIRISPYMQEVLDGWSGSDLRRITLTSVGMALGHANLTRVAGEFADLSSWIS